MSGLEGLLAGHTLCDRYRIDAVIGRGGFAAVYRAEDERLGRTVALKVITLGSADPAVRDSIRRRFAREGRVAASLHHVNVATVFDVGTDPRLDLDFLVMELLHGEDLAARLARGEPPAPRETVRLLRDAARGLAAGHARGLIHRDVKPANIFLAEQERSDRFRVCILDFGIAQIRSAEHSLTRLTRGGAPLSPPYASPEQLREARDVTPAADVWGLGVIAYQLFAGERPFDPDAVHAMARGDEPPPLRFDDVALPTGMEAVIRRALAAEPGRRFPDAGEMAEALHEVLDAMRAEDRPVAAAPITPAAPPVAEPQPLASARPEPGPPVEAAPAAPAPRRAAGTQPRRRSPLLRLAVPLVLLLAALGGWWALSLRNPGESRVAERQPASPPSQPAAVPRGSEPTIYSGSGAPTSAGDGTASGTTSAREAAGSTTVGESSAAPGRSAPAPGGAAAAPAASSPSPPSPEPQSAARSTSPAASSRRASSSGSSASRTTAAPAGTSPAPVAAGRAAALNRQAERLFDRGDYAGAVAGFQRAVAAAPDNSYYRNNLGWALFLAGDLDGAERELRETVRIDPRRAIAYANLGEVRWRRGDVEGAVANYRRFLALNTDPRRERIAVDKLRRMGAEP